MDRFISFLKWIRGSDSDDDDCSNKNRRYPDPGENFILRQMFDRESYTYTYLLGDLVSRDAILIDPVFDYAERDSEIAEELQLNLRFVLNTHVHADHVTGSGFLKHLYGNAIQSIISVESRADADIKVNHGDLIFFGGYSLEVRYTPGHTSGCVCYVFHTGKMIFTGDTLLIRGCGRTDFQGGCPKTLYTSVHSQIFTLPNDYIVYPAHDYKGRTCSTIGEEKVFNPRLTRSLSDFMTIMEDYAHMNSQPKMLHIAVPANRVCGLWNLPVEMERKLNARRK